MRKLLVLFLAAFAATVLVAAPAAAQETTYPIVTEFAVRQSMDLGDPFSYTMLVAQEKTVNPQHMIVIVADAGQLVNLEHPEGSEGLIVGELIVFDPEATWADLPLDNFPGEVALVYVGANTLPQRWSRTATYWTVNVRHNTTSPAIDVPNAEWVWRSVPLGTEGVTCPQNSSLCLYQAWNGIHGSLAWHIVLGPGDIFSPPFPMQGSLFTVTGVSPQNLNTLVARFAQMADEVIVRDNSPDMTLYKVRTAQISMAGWISISEFLFGYPGEINESHTLRVRETATTSSRIVGRLPQGTIVTIISRSASTPTWLLVQANEVRGWVPATRVRLPEWITISELPVFQAG